MNGELLWLGAGRGRGPGTQSTQPPSHILPSQQPFGDPSAESHYESILYLDKLKLRERKLHRGKALARMQVFELHGADSMYFASQHTSGSPCPQTAGDLAALRMQRSVR